MANTALTLRERVQRVCDAHPDQDGEGLKLFWKRYCDRSVIAYRTFMSWLEADRVPNWHWVAFTQTMTDMAGEAVAHHEDRMQEVPKETVARHSAILHSLENVI